MKTYRPTAVAAPTGRDGRIPDAFGRPGNNWLRRPGRCLGRPRSFRVALAGADRPPRTSSDRCLAHDTLRVRPLGRRSAGHDLHEPTAQGCRGRGRVCQPPADLRRRANPQVSAMPAVRQMFRKISDRRGVSSGDAPTSRSAGDDDGAGGGGREERIVENPGGAWALVGRRAPGDHVDGELHHPRPGADPDQLAADLEHVAGPDGGPELDVGVRREQALRRRRCGCTSRWPRRRTAPGCRRRRRGCRRSGRGSTARSGGGRTRVPTLRPAAVTARAALLVDEPVDQVRRDLARRRTPAEDAVDAELAGHRLVEARAADDQQRAACRTGRTHGTPPTSPGC